MYAMFPQLPKLERPQAAFQCHPCIPSSTQYSSLRNSEGEPPFAHWCDWDLCHVSTQSLILLSPIAQRCNEHGESLAPGMPPVPPMLRSVTDWSPFNSRVGFELAEFIFSEAELSRKKIDCLLELWAATLVPYGTLPPFTNHVNLLRQVDSIPLGGVPWESFSLGYKNPPPKSTRPPEWKITEYDVWFRNPCEAIKEILGNSEFDGHIDYSAYREFEHSQRRYCNMMSGDWAWQQSVCLASSVDL